MEVEPRPFVQLNNQGVCGSLGLNEIDYVDFFVVLSMTVLSLIHISFFRVQSGCRLVHDNHFRVADDGLGDPESSFHTPG